MKKNIKAFSLVELIVVVMIIIILSTIGLVNYIDTLSDSRNATRISDMGNLKMSLKNHKLKNGIYPIPGNHFDITNSGTIIKQGFLNEETYTTEIGTKPTDPTLETQYYHYSITANGLFFQIAMSLEDKTVTDLGLRAFVNGDYQTVSYTTLPSIIFATSSSGSIQSLSGTFIVDKGTLNLPYDEEGNYVNLATDLSSILAEENINIPKFFGYYSCLEIYENGRNVGELNYQLLDASSEVYCQSCSSTGLTLSDSGTFIGNTCN